MDLGFDPGFDLGFNLALDFGSDLGFDLDASTDLSLAVYLIGIEFTRVKFKTSLRPKRRFFGRTEAWISVSEQNLMRKLI